MTLDPEVKDARGLPVGARHLRVGRQRRAARRRRARQGGGDDGRLRRASGAHRPELRRPRHGQAAAWATTRRPSVVNSFGQSHDVPNLFICDTSVFVTGAGVNPTLTAMALARPFGRAPGRVGPSRRSLRRRPWAPRTLPRHDVAVLAILANGIIPADERDAGAAAVEAGPRLAEMLASGAGAAVYARRACVWPGRSHAKRSAASQARSVRREVHDLLGRLAERAPAFFKQLRDGRVRPLPERPRSVAPHRVSGTVHRTGGHPDFDRPREG